MKLPSTVSLNVLEAYRELEAEGRPLDAANFSWDAAHVPRLSRMCVKRIVSIWHDHPLSELPLARDQDALQSSLGAPDAGVAGAGPRLPLALLARYVHDDAFWQRAYRERWGLAGDASDSEDGDDEAAPYVRRYLEAHCSEYLENLHPRDYDPEQISELVRLCGPHVRRLRARSLVPGEAACGARAWLDGEADVTEAAGQYFRSRARGDLRDHVPLGAVLGGLPLLAELHLTFGARAAGAQFERAQFQLTAQDARRLARGLQHCPALRTLRITRSALDCARLGAVLRGLAGSRVELLDLSHCRVADGGALLLARHALRHPACRRLVLADNRIGVRGAEALAAALVHPAARLLTLDLRLNSGLGSAGAAHLARALLRGCVLQNLDLSACGLDREPLPSAGGDAPDGAVGRTCGQLLAAAVAAGRSPLRELDLSVNDLGPAAGAALAGALEARGAGGPAAVRVRGAGCGRWEGVIARAALRNAARRRLAAQRFRRGACRLLAAARVARAIGIVETDPLRLARHLTARPSAVSVVSALSPPSLCGVPEEEPEGAEEDVGAAELLLVLASAPTLALEGPATGSSRASSGSARGASRRSSFPGTPPAPVQEAPLRRSALARRGSDGALVLRPDSRRIHISVGNTLN